jgi:hypothetical protein
LPTLKRVRKLEEKLVDFTESMETKMDDIEDKMDLLIKKVEES